MLAIRRYYQCDCDGESHTTKGREIHLPVIRAALDHHSRSTKPILGTEIGQGCLWRAVQDPIVNAVEERWNLRELDGALYLNEEMPAVYVDAARLYYTFRMNARSYFQEQESKRRKEEIEKSKQQRNGPMVFGRR